MIASELTKLWLQARPGRGVRSLAKLTGAHFTQIHRFVWGKSIDSVALGKIIAWMFADNGSKPVAKKKVAHDKKAKNRRRVH